MPHGPWPHLLLGPDPDRITNQIINRKVFHSFLVKRNIYPMGSPEYVASLFLLVS
jgi:hypothetical protein